MGVDIVTKEDLKAFKDELLEEIRVIVSSAIPPERKKWLKTYEVKKMLGISDGTLQNMRNKRIISYSIIGGLAFYDYGEILELMEKSKHTNRKNTGI